MECPETSKGPLWAGRNSNISKNSSNTNSNGRSISSNKNSKVIRGIVLVILIVIVIVILIVIKVRVIAIATLVIIGVCAFSTPPSTRTSSTLQPRYNPLFDFLYHLILPYCGCNPYIIFRISRDYSGAAAGTPLVLAILKTRPEDSAAGWLY